MSILKNFFVIEGLDGAGTTTQLKLLCSYLEKQGKSVHYTFEPTDSEIGKLIRRVLKAEVVVHPLALADLYVADRTDHLFHKDTGIVDRTTKGQIVISDRYFFSSLAYQSVENGYEIVQKKNGNFPYPEVLIFIDTPVSECIRRIESRGSEKEIFEKKDFLDKVNANYQRCLESLPEGCKLIKIDGTQSPEEILNQIITQAF